MSNTTDIRMSQYSGFNVDVAVIGDITLTGDSDVVRTDILGNTRMGIDAGNDLTSGQSNTLVGQLAFKSVVTGNYNTALGSRCTNRRSGYHRQQRGDWCIGAKGLGGW